MTVRSDIAEVIEAANSVAEGLDIDASPSRMLIADTLTVMVAGGKRAPTSKLLDPDVFGSSWRSRHREASNPSRYLVQGGGFGAPERVAYINAAAITDLEMDEGMRPTGHPCAHLLPAILAASECTDINFQELGKALVFGYEISAWLFESFVLRGPVHPHGHLATVAAAAAVAKILGLPILDAAMIAASMPQVTSWGVCLEGATARNLWVANSAHQAIIAQGLAKAGYTGSTAVLEQVFDGMIADFTPAKFPSTEAPKIAHGYIKFFPACALTHTSIQSAEKLAPLDSHLIDEVRVYTSERNLRAVAGTLNNALGRRFSIPFTVAASLVQSPLTVNAMDNPTRDVVELASRVQVYADKDYSKAWPTASPSRVEVLLKDGRNLTMMTENGVGVPGTDFTLDDLRQKSDNLLRDDAALWDAVMDFPANEVVSNLTARVWATQQPIHK